MDTLVNIALYCHFFQYYIANFGNVHLHLWQIQFILQSFRHFHFASGAQKNRSTDKNICEAGFAICSTQHEATKFSWISTHSSIREHYSKHRPVIIGAQSNTDHPVLNCFFSSALILNCVFNSAYSYRKPHSPFTLQIETTDVSKSNKIMARHKIKSAFSDKPRTKITRPTW